MNDNLNLVEILKDCPKGTKLYSTVYGEVEFDGINKREEYPVRYRNSGGTKLTVTAQGLMFSNYNGECTLFPSREERDWSKFKQLVKPKFKVGDKIINSLCDWMGYSVVQGTISEITDDKYIFTDSSYLSISNQDIWELVSDKKPKFDPKTLQPFDKVLVRDGYKERWLCRFFSYIVDGVPVYKYATIGSTFIYCIPYNDDTKHLVNTTNEAPEYYRYWED